MKTNAHWKNIGCPCFGDLFRLGWLACQLAVAMVVLTGNLSANESGGSGKVLVVRTPDEGEPLEARLGPDGKVHLLYQSPVQNIPYYVSSADAGAAFSSPIPVVDKSSQKTGLVFSGEAMAVGKNGTVYVALTTNNWKLKLPGVPEGLAFTTLAPGSSNFAPVRSLNNKPSEGFSLAAGEDGNVVATWLAGKLYANFSHDGGKTFTSNTELNPSYDPCDCCTTRVVYGFDGNLALLYREETGNKRDMHLVIVDKEGKQLRTRLSSTLWEINACPMTYFGLAATKHGYIAAWPTKGQIYFMRVDSKGKSITPGEVKTPGRSGMRTGLIALEEPDGKILIAWNQQRKLGWQVYSSDGQPEGLPGSVPTAGTGAAGFVDKKGRFVLFQ